MTTLKELLAQREALDKQIAEVSHKARSEAVSAALALISEHGLTQQDLFGGAASSVKKAKVARSISEIRNVFFSFIT